MVVQHRPDSLRVHICQPLGGKARVAQILNDHCPLYPHTHLWDVDSMKIKSLAQKAECEAPHLTHLKHLKGKLITDTQGTRKSGSQLQNVLGYDHGGPSG